jgi:uncharacterized glyoxalase superfamily protein PhnB
MLWTEDLRCTLDFYVEKLGFKFREYNEDLGWACIFIDDVSIMFSKPNEHASYDKIGFTGSFYFHTDDVDSLWEKLRDKAEVCYGIEDFFYGMREFAVYDNNGYLLQFGQESRRKRLTLDESFGS